jgi:hypothetical protein
LTAVLFDELKPTHLIHVFKGEAASLAEEMYTHPLLGRFFSKDFSGVSTEILKGSYMQWLKMLADYVSYTVPMLRASSENLRDGDDDDGLWSRLFDVEKKEETDEKKKSGHHIWAIDDMKALGASDGFISAPQRNFIKKYGDFHVSFNREHPYGSLGAKGILEHLAVTVCEPMRDGLLVSGIENIANAVSFISAHGELDKEHTKAGNRFVLDHLKSSKKCLQVLAGANATSEMYRALMAAIPTR